MKRKVIIALVVLVLGAIVARFFGVGIIMVALILLGIGYFIGRRQGPKSKSKDIVLRIRR